ncbi:nitroreductase family protein [Clostridioides mangenotii]|uniref:nitroreductase family protein n=1 Tax=Metaclostridioides mangenotii TaxID=1540 RepID=UPI00214A2410|nr:nitroreductase family protein [Clostridioides mangenotii]MCR1953352.1 nitroreductase family protein [Clostridioides mangenotii]
METLNSIFSRRSIRRFSSEAIPKDLIEIILKAGISAPSPKNRQTWHFLVFTGEHKKDVIDIILQGTINESENNTYLPKSVKFLSGAFYTIETMKKAPVIIFVYDPDGKSPYELLNTEERFFEMSNIQSIGASLQNMSIAATDLGIGSLWICDIYFAYNELVKYLNIDGQLVACMAFGFSEESPKLRPRKDLEKVVTWNIK